MNEARRHAVTASELLASTERISERLATMSPEDRLQMAATGKIGQVNRDLQWTVELATAHALAAIALNATDPLHTEPLLAETP